MKTNHKTQFPAFAALLVLVLSGSLARADDEAEHVALRKIKAAYEDAVNSGNPGKIGPFLAKGATGVMVTGEPVEGIEGLESYWKKIQSLIGPGGSYHVSVNADKSELFGDIAVSTGTTDDIVRLANGSELKFNSSWTAISHKENGEWKLVRMQATMDPVENVFVSTKLKFTKITYGVGGMVLGALMIMVVGLARRKRK